MVLNEAISERIGSAHVVVFRTNTGIMIDHTEALLH